MKRLVIGLTAVLVLSLFAVVGNRSLRHVEAGSINFLPLPDCTGALTFPSGSTLTFTRDNTGATQEQVHLIVTDGAGTELLHVIEAGTVGTTFTWNTTYLYSTPPSYNPVIARIVSPAGGTVGEQLVGEQEVLCLGLPNYIPPTPGGSATPPAALPGCDLRMPITSSSVVGAFVADAAVYSLPGTLADPLLTIEAGKTAWVLGQDASGDYYKIVWGCSQFWVQESTLGPNYDRVWQGAPLPTGVVS